MPIEMPARAGIEAPDRHAVVGLRRRVDGAAAGRPEVIQVPGVAGPDADPVALGSVAVLLSAVGLLACLLPARRAARLDPVHAQRHE